MDKDFLQKGPLKTKVSGGSQKLLRIDRRKRFPWGYVYEKFWKPDIMSCLKTSVFKQVQ
jgi:hypothetical protein